MSKKQELVVYYIQGVDGRKRSSLQVVRLNEANEIRSGLEHKPSSADVIAYIRNMPKRDKQRVFRDLIKDLAEQATKGSAGARAKK